MKISKETICRLSLLITIPIMNRIYTIINTPGAGVHSLVTDVDRGTPFIKYFIIPYIIWFGFLYAVLIYLGIKDKETYYKTLITVNISILICYIIFIVFQTTVPRPQLTGNDIFTKGVQYIYNRDKPFNCFPSIHCITSFIMVKAVYNSKVKNLLNVSMVGIISFSIILSTLFIKQHVVLDVIAAIFLGNTIFNFINKYIMERSRIWIIKQYLSSTTKKILETL